MTLRDEIQQKIDAIKAKSTADVAELEDHLAKGGNVIDLEIEAAEAWLQSVIAKVRAAL